MTQTTNIQDCAHKDSFRSRPMPTLRDKLRYKRNFTLNEYQKISAGLIPQMMEDKWFIYFEDDILYFHRSWTGICVYQVQITESDMTYFVSKAFVNRDIREYQEQSNDYDLSFLSFLIESLLLNKKVPFPERGLDMANDNNGDIGAVYTKGDSYRARAEKRQREFRVFRLESNCDKYGHMLDSIAIDKGYNFATDEVFKAALQRQLLGKGVAPRTFNNMLSSQAMCFNIFVPLQNDTELAQRILSNFIPELKEVTEIHIEYTPENTVFNDQSGRGGVDCDVLVLGKNNQNSTIVLTIETKFVEPEFSICGFRKSGRSAKKLEVCSDEITLRTDFSNCLYASKKHYLYWERSIQCNTLFPNTMPKIGCPFAGSMWQLWVNHTLAHVEAANRNAGKAYFGVCAPIENKRLFTNQNVVDRFKSLLKDSDSLIFIDLDNLLKLISEIAPSINADYELWADYLTSRYADI